MYLYRRGIVVIAANEIKKYSDERLTAADVFYGLLFGFSINSASTKIS